MPIQTACSSCLVKIQIKEELIGKTLKCPKCGARIVIPPDRGAADRSNATPDADACPTEGATVSYLQGKETEPNCTEPANDLPTVPGYRVLREIARGGMGRVLVAQDVNLDRLVALKILLPGANADRFIRESKITAQLPHPGIPPVHALGTLADGSPFLAMKLIAGETLAVEMKSADRPRLLQVFTRVCQAVGFAHSRGVIHRDLKPANVMVGAFGEVQVMDWGLAKELSSRTVNDEPRSSVTSTIAGADANQTTDHREPGESTDDQTKAGQVMGTPTYMAPEQARGEVTDTRSDVFALGGILCAILTGQPPFRGQSLQQVIQRAAAADVGEALDRLDGCGADAELIELTKSCLAPDPVDRPKDAQVVAEAMTAYLEGVERRMHEAEVAQAEAKARAAEGTTRRRLALALAATVLLALMLGGAGWLWIKTDRDAHQAQVTSDVNDALNQAGAFREQAKTATEAGAALILFAQGHEQAQRAWTLAESGPVDEPLSGRVQTLQTELAAEEAVVKEAMELYRRAVALNPKYVDEARVDEAITLYRRAIGLFPRYVNAHIGLGAALRARGQTDKAIECYRQAIALNPQDANANVGMGAALKAIGQTDASIESCRHAIALDPKLATAHTGLGSALHLQGKWEEAIDCHNQALTLDPKLVEAHINLGLALAAKGQADDAIECYRQAIALDPKDASGHASLGLALVGKRKTDEAVASCRQAIGLNPKLALAHAGLGFALMDKRQVDEAIRCYRQAIALDARLALAHTNLGIALISKRQLDEAVAFCRRAIAIDPKDANTHIGLGLALNARGEADEAMDSCNRAIALSAGNANAHFVLGDALLGKSRTDEAIASYLQAVALDPNHVPAHANLGFALGAKGDVEKAIDHCRKALALAPRDIDANYWMGVALLRKGADEGRDINEVIREAGKYIELAGALDRQRTDVLLQKSVNLKNKTIGIVHEVGSKGLELRDELAKLTPAIVYQVKLTAGKTYVIDMISPNPKALDPFLLLSDAADQKLAEDDDSGGGLNARIVFRAEQTAAYRIRATSHQSRGVGPFTLTLRESNEAKTERKANLVTARNYAVRGDWKAAIAEYAQAFQEEPLRDGERGFEYAAALLLSGNQAGYRKICAEMLERSGQPGIRPYHVARACTLAPDSVKDLVLAGKKAANELEKNGNAFWSLTEQGALKYRAGRHDDSATLFEKSLQADRKPGRGVLNWIWLSMVEHRRGKSADAQAWLDKATKWLEQYPKGIPPQENDSTGLHLHNWLEAQILHREATALLKQ